MLYNQLFFLQEAFFPFLGLLFSPSTETIALGIVSLCLLFLFFYTIKSMGGKPEQFLETAEPQELELNHPSQGFGSESFPFTDPSNSESNQPMHAEVSEIVQKRFLEHSFSTIARNFLKNLPNQAKLESAQLYIHSQGEFCDYLILKRNLFIECDRVGILEEEESIIENLKNCKGTITNKRKKLLVPIYSPTTLYGALVLESVSGFHDKDILIYQNFAQLFGIEWESRLEYELAILDPNTNVYNKNHFFTILEEKFHAFENMVLFIIEAKNTDNIEAFQSFMGDFLPYPVYRVSDRQIAFFTRESDLGNITILMQNAIHELDSMNFYAEFILGFAHRKQNMSSSEAWLQEALEQIKVARKKIRYPEKATA